MGKERRIRDKDMRGGEKGRMKDTKKSPSVEFQPAFVTSHYTIPSHHHHWCYNPLSATFCRRYCKLSLFMVVDFQYLSLTVLNRSRQAVALATFLCGLPHDLGLSQSKKGRTFPLLRRMLL
jgi:hypothetical protein